MSGALDVVFLWLLWEIFCVTMLSPMILDGGPERQKEKKKRVVQKITIMKKGTRFDVVYLEMRGRLYWGLSRKKRRCVTGDCRGRRGGASLGTVEEEEEVRHWGLLRKKRRCVTGDCRGRRGGASLEEKV